jgi:hypothetical protein
MARLQLEEYEYEIIYTAGTLNANADCLSRIHMITDSNNHKDYKLLKAKEKPILNKKIIEIPNSIQNATPNENILLPISGDLIITHLGIREYIEKIKFYLQFNFQIRIPFIFLKTMIDP